MTAWSGRGELPALRLARLQLILPTAVGWRKRPGTYLCFRLNFHPRKKERKKRQEERGVTQWRSFNSWARVDEHLLSVWHGGAMLIGGRWRRSAVRSGNFCSSRLCLCCEFFPRGDHNQKLSSLFSFFF